ncbi:phosphoglycerate kinase [Coemansia sp. RSA 1807]|nr:phosphoglycerate kinase [Coemansia sp. RSA 921]KAJ2280734.1 phosphoglycerate kinase [Coemansia sp. RSA 451]KAJ2532026.1 phosphoglycerate kinase [Coemansia sp. RSA 1937]KAJ2570390.1 phosphoglycerate kinase [Coemansia sp. RSA 1807]
MSISNKLSIKDIDVKDKRVLARVNFSSNNLIAVALPTIKYLQEHGAAGVVLISHRGRPNGQVVAKYSLKPAAEKLEELLGQSVTFLSDCVGAEVESACANLTGGQVVLLENLQFHIEEEGSVIDSQGNMTNADPSKVKEFRKSLTKLGDIYVNDVFGKVHRAHSSMVGVDLPVRAAGLLMQKELEYFGKVMEDPDRPCLAIVGGFKLSNMAQLIDSLLDKVDIMIVTGSIAYTFLKVVSGMNIGNSLYDSKDNESAQKLADKAKKRGVTFVLPRDFIVVEDLPGATSATRCTMQEGIPEGWQGQDIGPESIDLFGKIIFSSKTIVWSGSISGYEVNVDSGTKRTINNIIDAHSRGATTIVAGSDTTEIVFKQNVAPWFSHVTTGGSASNKLLEGKELPGVAALSTK